MKYLLAWLLFAFSVENLTAQEETDGWFPFVPSHQLQHSRINMQHWLDAPAGKHGFIEMKKDKLFFDDGTPIKFWGVNIASNRPFIPEKEAIRWADFMAAYGINGVRFHKFTWDATDEINSTQLTPKNWQAFDFFNARLKSKGIYTAWSHIYGHRVRPADSTRLLNYNEVAETRFPWSHLNGTTASLVNFAEDLQALNIELTINMLQHRNSITGLRYAEDPALICIELQNEDNIFWSAIETTLKQTPTYRDLLCKKFSAWLEKKYKTQSALENAWGKNVLPAGETIASQNIYPQPNHGLFSAESEKAWKDQRPIAQHVIDKAFFLFEEQNKFYQKFVNAIRETGYKGLIVGSCWQAGSGLAHLLNLYADYNVGVIDRHNYFGGGTGHRLESGKVNNKSMISSPGSGLLSTGFQQVSDRPFFISEWMSLIPNEWTAESSPLVAAYGLGLQGWDASFAFAMDFDHFTSTIQSGHGVYNVTSPTQLALYPALAAMIYRNDFREGAIVAKRNISISDLQKGRLTMFEKVEQEADIKNLQSSIPLKALAEGRVVLTFNSQPAKKDPKPVISLDKLDTIIQSNTGQLRWSKEGQGYVTLHSGGTEGLIGFAAGRILNFKNMVLQTSTPFAVILATSLEQNAGLEKSKRILITTVARARNTGMKYNDDKTRLEEVGVAPLLLEPVEVNVQMKNPGNVKVYVLDHSGNRTDIMVPVSNGKFLLDGQLYKSIYYEIVRG